MPNRSEIIDLHMHTTASDGTDTPQALLENVRKAGITTFSVTDHDTVNAAQILCPLLMRGDPRFIPGAEFSCKDAHGKYHILGYGFDPTAASLHVLASRAHGLRMEKVKMRLALLETEYGFVFPPEEIDRLLSMDNPGKPHIGNLMVQYGYVRSKDEAMRDYLSRIRVQSGSIPPEDVIGGILAGGGIPVLAHPCFGSGSDNIPADEMEKRVRRLMDFGLQGIEAFYSGFSETQRTDMLALAEKYDLYVTAGSDYHGMNKTVVLGDTGLNGTDAFPDGLTRFLGDVGICSVDIISL